MIREADGVDIPQYSAAHGRRPGPWVAVKVLDVSNHLCLQGDQMDVPDQVPQTAVVFVRDGFVTIFKEVPGSIVASIEGDGVTGHESLHDLAERDGIGPKEKMELVWHQGPGPREIGYRISRGKHGIRSGCPQEWMQAGVVGSDLSNPSN